MEILIYTDGSAKENLQKSGFAGIILAKSGGRILKTRYVLGRDVACTHNRMELLAVVEALKTLTREGVKLTITSDSRYVIDGITKWANGWKARGWKRVRGQDLANVDLWKELHTLNKTHFIKWLWVKGHSGDEYNAKCDELAGLCADHAYTPDEIYICPICCQDYDSKSAKMFGWECQEFNHPLVKI